MGNATVISAAWTGASQSLLKTEIVLFMHGMYVIVVVCALLSLRRRRLAGARILGCLIAAMCVMGTVEVVLRAVTTALWFRWLSSAAQDDPAAYFLQGKLLGQMGNRITFTEDLLVITNNALADGLLIYRCCVIWDSSKRKVIGLPVLLALGTAASGYMSSYQRYAAPTSQPDLRIFFGLVVATNLTLTGLTIGRIWYTRQNLRVIGQTKLVQRSTTAIKLLCAVIVEQSVAESTLAVDILYAISAELMNVIPALVVVQISWGQRLEFLQAANQLCTSWVQPFIPDLRGRWIQYFEGNERQSLFSIEHKICMPMKRFAVNLLVALTINQCNTINGAPYAVSNALSTSPPFVTPTIEAIRASRGIIWKSSSAGISPPLKSVGGRSAGTFQRVQISRNPGPKEREGGV
ncbi:hypothetical protein DFH09DRAFT_1275742 [Mycena vulgaris]|nr:hypothetical protein DFH09DRAFT_1275742 [Mycena vulgaris]